MSTWSSLNFMDSNCPSASHLVEFHDHALAILFFILMVVMSVLVGLTYAPTFSPAQSHALMLEFIWTFLPMLVLVTIAIPSLMILFLMEEKPLYGASVFTTKVTGFQWYWEYEPAYSWANVEPNTIESYMIPSSALSDAGFRLLDTTGFLPLVAGLPNRLMITSSDVIHSWALPSMSVKMDACPGRLNELVLWPHRTGVYYGQCSEICGANHSFMPIEVKVMTSDTWGLWLGLDLFS